MIRSQFKVETNQMLYVSVNDLNTLMSGSQFFYAKMQKDGRILIPQIIIRLIQNDNQEITGHILEATIEPGQTQTPQ